MGLGNLIGAIILWVLSALCGYGAYSVLNLIWTGLLSQNWMMVIAGGIIAYFVLGLLITGCIAFFVFAIMVLVD